jgi:hypothetical protein
MQFDPELQNVVEQCFKPAVGRAGFELRLITDGQPAGLIDDQLRVALRNSRFVLAHTWQQRRILGSGIRRRTRPASYLHLQKDGVGRTGRERPPKSSFRHESPGHDHLGAGQARGCRQKIDCNNPSDVACGSQEGRLALVARGVKPPPHARPDVFKPIRPDVVWPRAAFHTPESHDDRIAVPTNPMPIYCGLPHKSHFTGLD